MATAVVDVYNLALGFAHARGTVASLSENSREREVCDVWYAMARDLVQAAAWWPECRQIAILGTKVERDFGLDWAVTDPDPEFAYSYAIPTDYQRAWHLTSYLPFTLRYNTSTSAVVLSTNQDDAHLVYAAQLTDVTKWTPQLEIAVASALAAFVVGPLSGRNSLIELNINRANKILQDMQTVTQNSPDYYSDSIPDWISARGYAESAPKTRFIYPHGALLSTEIVAGT